MSFKSRDNCTSFLFLFFRKEQYDDWNKVHPLAVDDIVMKTTILAVFVYCIIVIIHEKYSNQIHDNLILSYNIKFLSGTLNVILMFLILIKSFGWLLLIYHPNDVVGKGDNELA